MVDDAKLLRDFLTQLGKEVKTRLPKVSGATAQGIEVEIDSDGVGRLVGPEYIQALESGRGPTRPGAVKGSPTLWQRLVAWVQAKGFAQGKEAKGIAGAIANKIHKEGTLLYRIKGKSGVISSVITEKRLEVFSDVFATEYFKYTFNTLSELAKR